MSTEPSPRAEQIQANVAAALSRLRGEPTPGGNAVSPPVITAAPNVAAPNIASPGNGASPDILTKAEPLLDIGGDAPAPQNQPGIGVPDPAMSLGGRSPETPFERMTGLKMSGVKLEDQPDLLQDMGVPPPPLADLPDADVEAQRRRRRLRNRLMLGGFAVILLVGFWILSGGDGANEEIPVITADGTPERVKPEEEGGLTVPNQDVAILNNDTAAAATAETVMPAPEQPATPPPPPEPVAEPVVAAPAVTDPAAESAATTAPAIPSVSAPEPTEIPSVAAPTELAPDAQPAAAATAAEPGAAEPATAAAEPAATQTAAVSEAPTVTAAIQPVPGGKIRVQLASVKSEDGARQEWSRLQRAHPALLGGLELNVERFEKSAGEVYYRVQAGPLGDAASAKLICSELKQKNQACIVAK